MFMRIGTQAKKSLEEERDVSKATDVGTARNLLTRGDL